MEKEMNASKNLAARQVFYLEPIRSTCYNERKKWYRCENDEITGWVRFCFEEMNMKTKLRGIILLISLCLICVGCSTSMASDQMTVKRLEPKTDLEERLLSAIESPLLFEIDHLPVEKTVEFGVEFYENGEMVGDAEAIGLLTDGTEEEVIDSLQLLFQLNESGEEHYSSKVVAFDEVGGTYTGYGGNTNISIDGRWLSGYIVEEKVPLEKGNKQYLGYIAQNDSNTISTLSIDEEVKLEDEVGRYDRILLYYVLIE